MKQIYYVIQALIHGRGANIIKVVSLGLGLTMSILLFSRVVYEQSFDTCFKDHDKLYQLWNIWTVNGEPFPPSEFIIGAAAGGILDAMPEIVESAASTGSWPVSAPIYNGSVRFDDFKVTADSLFFQTMGIEVLSGDPVRELQQKDVIFLSKDLADKMFGGENPIGKIISFNKEIELTVKGTYDKVDISDLEEPCRRGIPAAIGELAARFRIGVDGAEKNPSKAFKLYQEVLKYQRNAWALRCMGVICEEGGLGKPENLRIKNLKL